MSDIKALASRFSKFNRLDQYQQVKKAIEQQVVCWRWATEDMFNVEPFEKEKNKFPHGRWVKDDAKPKLKEYRHGLDDQQQVVVIRDAFYERYFFRHADHIEVLIYDAGTEKQLVSLLDSRLQNALPSTLVGMGSHAYSIYSYEYCDDKLVLEKYEYTCLNSAAFDQYLETPVPLRWRRAWRSLNAQETDQVVMTYSYAYDALGRLETIHQTVDKDTLHPDETQNIPQLIYRRPQKGESIKQLSELVEAKLLAHILEALTQAKIQDPIYCLLLVYDAENDLLPPWLALGQGSRRQEIVKKHGKQAKYRASAHSG